MQVSRPQVIAIVAGLAIAAFAYHSLSRPHAAARAAGAPNTGMPSFLRFSGSGGVSVRPDRATVNFTTTGRGSSLAAATNQASARMRAVLAAMRAQGIARINMSTGSVSGSRVHAAIPTYRASQELTVTVMKIGKTGPVISAGIKAGASANYGPGFSPGRRIRRSPTPSTRQLPMPAARPTPPPPQRVCT